MSPCTQSIIDKGHANYSSKFFVFRSLHSAPIFLFSEGIKNGVSWYWIDQIITALFMYVKIFNQTYLKESIISFLFKTFNICFQTLLQIINFQKVNFVHHLKFRYCEKATKFEKIFHFFWNYFSNVKRDQFKFFEKLVTNFLKIINLKQPYLQNWYHLRAKKVKNI